jgi:large repetitive protein
MEIAPKKTVVPYYRSLRSIMLGVCAAVILAWGWNRASAATAPGPDAFGYTAATTSNYSFTNITNNLTAKRTLVLVDDAAVTVNIGFTFNFYGSNYTTVSICENGFLTFGGTNISPVNGDLTAALNPDLPTIAVFWDDWETLNQGRPVFYDTIGSVGSRQFIVQWERVVAVDPSTGFDPVTFQVRLFEGNNSILFSYPDVVLTDGPGYGRGANQTIGIRDRNGQSNNRNLQWSHNQEVLSNGQNIIFSRPNRAPVAVDDSIVISEDWAALVHVLANDTDPDGNPVSVVGVTEPTNGTLAVITNTVIRYTPAADYTGEDYFTYTIGDGQGGFATGTVAVVVVDQNDRPVAVADSYRIAEDAELVVSPPGVLGNDSDLESASLFVVLVRPPAHGVFVLQQNGGFTYTPPPNYFGEDTFVYRASDGILASLDTTVTITVDSVNDLPVAQSSAISTEEDTATNMTLRGWDADDENVTFILLSNPGHGTVNGAPPELTYRPATNFHGADALTFAVRDNSGNSATGTVFITVRPINEHAPVAATDAVRTRLNAALTITNEVLLANDSDADIYDQLVITGVPARTTAGGTLAFGPDTIRYVPPTNFLGPDSFTYVVLDGQGSSATGMVQLTVLPLVLRLTGLRPTSSNSMVVAFEGAPGGTYNVEASENLVQWTVLGRGVETGPGRFELNDINAAAAGRQKRFYRATGAGSATAAANDAAGCVEDEFAEVNVIANDASVDGFLVVTAVTQGTNGNVTISSRGVVKYTPAANFNGADHFTYTVSDGDGHTVSATVAVNVEGRSDAPVAATNAYEVGEDLVLVVNSPGILGNDMDVDGDTLSAILVTAPAHGVLSLNQDGSFRYNPSSNYFGVDTFVYRANDGNLFSSDTPVTITVDQNDPPVAQAENISTAEDTPIGVRLRGVDPDGDLLSFSVLTGPGSGTLSGAVPELVYLPGTNFNGADVFRFTVSDGRGYSATGTVSITVTPVNEHSPVAINDAVRTWFNTTLLITNSALLANDSDADIYDRLTISAVPSTTSAGGTLTLGPTTIRYVPATNFVGSDSFAYVVSDGQGGGATGVVQVTVSPLLYITRITPTPSNSMLIVFESVPGGTYNVEASQDLVQWTVLGPGVETTSGTFEFDDIDAPIFRSRFYRATTRNEAPTAPTNAVPPGQ